MVSSDEIKTSIFYNRKVFSKIRYKPNDVVWWIDNGRINGIVLNVQGYYCYIRDEYNNEYIKPHLELFLDEANIIQDLMNELVYIKKDIHNLNSLVQTLMKPAPENTSFSIQSKI